MVHSFSVVVRKNCNLHVEFMDDSSKRRIIFEKDSDAIKSFFNVKRDNLFNTKEIIVAMKKEYFFMANPNNTSIFRPIDRSYLK